MLTEVLKRSSNSFRESLSIVRRQFSDASDMRTYSLRLDLYEELAWDVLKVALSPRNNFDHDSSSAQLVFADFDDTSHE